jgi:phospholipid-binding lipoprotein MlaA
MMKRSVIAFCGLAVAAAMLTAPPAWADNAKPGMWDPLESLNRSVYSFNSAFGTSVANQIATAYDSTVPESVRAGVDNVFTNLREPLTVVASGLSGDMKNAGLSAGRFAINTTAGIGGVYDVATRMGWVSRPTDFGMTLCHYNVPPGPYLVLPFVGASTVRDAAGVLAAYWAAFWVLEGWAPAYIIADRAVSYSTDHPASAPEAAVGDAYAEQRDHYQTLRAGLCDGSIPGDRLKAGPIGRVAEVAPHG